MDYNSMYGNTSNNNYDMMMLMNQSKKDSYENKEVKDQKGLVGIVTKFQSGIGYIDDLIFFDTTALQGCYPKIGDKVLVDASYDELVPLKWKAYRIQSLPIIKQTEHKKFSENNHSYKSYIKNEGKPNYRNENGHHYNRKNQGSGFIDYDAPPNEPAPDMGGMFNFMMRGAGNAQPNLTLPTNNTNMLLNNDLSAATAALMMAAAGGGLGAMLPQNPGANQSSGLVNPSFNRASDFVGQKRSRHGALDRPGSRGGADAYSRSRERSNARSVSRDRRYKHDRPDLRRSPPKSKRAEGRHYDNKANEDHKRSPPPHNNGNKRRRSPNSPPNHAPTRSARMKCNIPRVNLSRRFASVYEVWNRFPNMYIPSEFVMVKYRWMDDFPIDKPLSLNVYSQFEIYSKKDFDEKDVDYSHNNASIPRQPDATSGEAIAQDIITVKVMLFNCPGLQVLYDKSFGYDGLNIDELPRNFRHLSRLLKFLLANKGKKDNMALGGQWSAKLDGPDPINNPSTLINTAIRTTKNMTGIDLSSCVNWYRMMEIYYRRSGEECGGGGGDGDDKKKTKDSSTTTTNTNLTNEASRQESMKGMMEKVYVLMPDVWSLIAPLSMAGISTADSNKVEIRTGSVAGELSSNGTMMKSGVTVKKEILSDGGLDSTREETHLSDNPTTSSPHTNVLKIKTEPFMETDGALLDDSKEAIDSEPKNVGSEAYTPYEVTGSRSKPSISVFPSKKACNGKFDCSLVPLSTMLDYNEENTREYVFEVSLFAEAFNDMLQRDFGYYIYRTLCNNGNSESENRCDLPMREDICEQDKGSLKQEENSEEAKSRAPTTAYSKKIDIKTNETNEIVHTKNEDRRESSKNMKPYVKDPFLLMSYTYFDTTFNGYLLEKNLEAILFSLDLALTRAQVKKLYSHLISKGTLNYRDLTDGHYNEKAPDPVISSTFTHNELTFGNKLDVERLSDRASVITAFEHSDAGNVNPYGHVDVPNLLKRLRTLEEASLIADNKFVELNKESAALKLSVEKETNKAKHRGEEIKKLEDKLHNNRKETEGLKRELDDAKRAINFALENLKNSSRKLESIVHTSSKEDTNEPEKNKPAS